MYGRCGGAGVEHRPRPNERTNKHTSERTNEQTHKRTNERTNERPNEGTNEETNERRKERTNEGTNERTNEQTNGRAEQNKKMHQNTAADNCRPWDSMCLGCHLPTHTSVPSQFSANLHHDLVEFRTVTAIRRTSLGSFTLRWGFGRSHRSTVDPASDW